MRPGGAWWLFVGWLFVGWLFVEVCRRVATSPAEFREGSDDSSAYLDEPTGQHPG
ncbi:hypothetical protein JCM18899A_28960 [Nocardioides sp. AN3]